ncbi:MAG: hypothetical protein LH649_10100 [Pseudanabaena sp. CAN_BIN31]|nr:hypothetical protein [Pseudanabaena sp. CAN_BIN31]
MGSITLVLVGLLSFSGLGYFVAVPLQLAKVQNSHIQRNVPSQFDEVLQRDLTSYFQGLNAEIIKVEYELLRNVPTQVSVGTPKYYIWVKLYGQKGLIEEGAVKVAAVEKMQFTVLNYSAIADLKKSPERINQVFPLPVGDKIRSHIK